MIFIIKIFIFFIFCFIAISILSPLIKQVLETEEPTSFIPIMQKIIKKNGLTLFYKTDFDKQKSIYEYQEGNFQFEITTNEQMISVCVYQKSAVSSKRLLFEALVNQHTHQVMEQKFPNYTLKKPKKELKIIQSFLSEVSHFPWTREQKENKSSIHKIAHLKEKLHTDFKRDLNSTIYEICEKMIDKIEKISHFLDSSESTISLETKHRFYQLIDNELINLISNFSKLPTDEQKKYEEKLINGLIKIEHSLSLIERNHHFENIQDFEKTLKLISKRYKD